ncbi:MAG: hypothetical protein VKJ24_08605 [Synechococcales bacterium]|nr:hypothetical protein [Synechococcales bacterium]
MTNLDQDNVHLVTGVVVAIDSEDGILIAGILSDNPFAPPDSASSKKVVGNYAFTRRQAAFLKQRLDDFLNAAEV